MHIPADSADAHVLGVDIGGANLKYADGHGRALAVEFPLWKCPDKLADQLIDDLGRFPLTTLVVATMTGELADCFLDRTAGVSHLTEHLQRATEERGLPAPLFYGVDGQFRPAASANAHPELVASANWHALATFVAQQMPARAPLGGLLIDIGSTTTDLIPFRKGTVASDAQTDFDRLAEHSLVYLGGGRTPVCSVVDHLRWEGRRVSVMREVFATMNDVRVLLGYQAPDPTDLATADARPSDTFHAANRLARMIGLDHQSVGIDAARDLARQVHQRARQIIGSAVAELEEIQRFDPRGLLVVSGHAEDLLPTSLASCEVLTLGANLGEAVSRCAPAYAVARLYMP
jgi:probable H4MPT-linked C1 transfer pathway protein